MIRTYSLLMIAASMLLAINSAAQKKTRDLDKITPIYLFFPGNQFTSGFTIPFSRIELIDYRYDTSKIGYLYGKRNKDKKVTAAGGIEKQLNAYLNNYFKNNLDPTSERTLLIILKKLWVQDQAINKLLQFKNPVLISPTALSDPLVTTTLTDMDVFAGNNDSYQALLQLTYDFPTSDYSGTDFLSYLLSPFDSLIRKINTLNIETELSRKNKFTLDVVRTTYQKRFDMPALQQPLNKGIFLTFSDFCNNKASHAGFTTNARKYSTDLIVQENGKPVTIADYWGFFDGEDLYVKIGHLSFKVAREGNTYDFYGSPRVAESSYRSVNTGLGPPTSPQFYRYIPDLLLQVDMQTGKVY